MEVLSRDDLAEALARGGALDGDPSLLAGTAALLAGLVPAGTELLAAPSAASVPLVTALSLITGLPATVAAAPTPPTGAPRDVGNLRGRRVLVVEDVVVSDDAAALGVLDLRTRGAVVSDAACVIDRAARRHLVLEGLGVALASLYREVELPRR